MVPLDVITSLGSRSMKRKDPEWQRLIISTGQSNFLSRSNQVQAFKTEQAEQDLRQKMLMDLKLKIALDMPIGGEPLNEEQISVAHARIFQQQSADFLGV